MSRSVLSTYSEKLRKFLFLVDSGASSTLVYAGLHDLYNVMVNRDIRTAGCGNITTVCEGMLFSVPVIGMGPVLLIQLCVVGRFAFIKI